MSDKCSRILGVCSIKILKKQLQIIDITDSVIKYFFSASV
jgi:hypothetical protein